MPLNLLGKDGVRSEEMRTHRKNDAGMAKEGFSASQGDMASFIPPGRAKLGSWQVLAAAKGVLGNTALAGRSLCSVWVRRIPAEQPLDIVAARTQYRRPLACKVASSVCAKNAKAWHCLGVTTRLRDGGCGSPAASIIRQQPARALSLVWRSY